jgi:ADP-ribose pyrophosphatase YjhB (NUDIX family)
LTRTGISGSPLLNASAQAAQSARLKLWTLPSGKRGESLVKALKRELYEEAALRAQIGFLLGVLDRCDKDAIALLFAAIPNNPSVKEKRKISASSSSGSFAPNVDTTNQNKRVSGSRRRGPRKSTIRHPASASPTNCPAGWKVKQKNRSALTRTRRRSFDKSSNGQRKF